MGNLFHGRDSGNTYVIESEIGVGGQGRVYLVRDESGKKYAAKWYKPSTGTSQQFQQIQELVQRGGPRTCDAGIHFIWPIEMLSLEGADGFGYVMPLIDTNRFHSHERICNRRVQQPTIPVLCRISARVAAAIDTLHASGLAYCDLNDKNIKIEPESGDIVVYDNDNVVVNNSPTQIKGVWEFMAPEVALSKSHPSAESDLYSLAVLLYRLWTWEHPMEGSAVLKIYSWDIPAKRKFFATSPVFVFHPTDASNTARGVPELKLHLMRWTRMCPPKLQRVFTDTFVEGVHNVAKRPRLPDWQRLFLELEANAATCACGAIHAWDGATKPFVCWKCNNPIPLAIELRVQHGSSGDSVLLASAGASLRQHHLDITRFDGDATKILGRVEAHPQSAGAVIIRNLSEKPWGYVAGGGLLSIDPGQARALIPGAELTIGSKTITVQLA
jgi:DNA-binding helix-hairpin-helix protein with protein kinase domain